MRRWIVRTDRSLFPIRPILVAAVIFSAAAVAVPGQSTTLRSVAHGVTPGAITAPLFVFDGGDTAKEELSLPGNGEVAGDDLRRSRDAATVTEPSRAIVVATEDRRIRLYGSDGRAFVATRTGIRRPAGVHAVEPGVLRVVSDDGTMTLYAYSGGVFTTKRVAPAFSTPDSVLPLIDYPPTETVVFPDRHENVYVLGPRGMITYVSATGTRLWSRRLPASVRSFVGDADGVYMGLEDGRVFAFLADGWGAEIHRLPAAVVDLAFRRDGRSNELVALDSDGALHRLVPETRGEGVRRQWSYDLGPRFRDGQTRFVSQRFAASIVVHAPGRGVVAITPTGERAWSYDVPGGEIVSAAHLPAAALTVVATDDARLVVIEARGGVASTLELSEPPLRIHPLEGAAQIFLEYPQWRYQIFAGFEVPDDVTRSGALITPPPVGTAGALDRLAEATFDGRSSQARLDLIESMERRVASAALFGRVATVRRITAHLAGEAYRGPIVRGGVVQNDFPTVRIAAIELLGAFGDAATRRVLEDIVVRDPDPSVAATALSTIGASGRGRIATLDAAFSRFERSPDRDRRILALGIVEFLEGFLPRTERERRRATEIAGAVAASDIPSTLRYRAIRALRPNQNRRE